MTPDSSELDSSCDSLSTLARLIYQAAKAKGFYSERVPLERELLLISEEVSEVFSEHRAGQEIVDLVLRDSTGVGVQRHRLTADGAYREAEEAMRADSLKPTGIGIELADVLIRTLCVMEANGLDAAKLVKMKLDYNSKRPFRHGKRF